MKGKLLYGQSGGPSSVINASAYGVVKQALEEESITGILMMHHGIEGALQEDFIGYDDFKEQLELLPYTPASAFGSCRYKMKDFHEDETDYKKLLEIFKKHDIRYFFYNGGNDSMDTCAKISAYVKQENYEMNVIGIPKTIDNDLPYTDHTPGFSSAAKFIINTVMQVKLDSVVYPKGKVTIVEIMGRHAGWLTASSYVANQEGLGPDLVYIPEVPFNQEQFVQDVKQIYTEKKNCLICVSEGARDKEGNFIGRMNKVKDAFGHLQLGGVGNYLGDVLEDQLGLKYRVIELSTIQRSATYERSLVDVNEAIQVGRKAVEFAVSGTTDQMVVMKRVNEDPYEVEYGLHPVGDIANKEQPIPSSMIKNDYEMNESFFEYMKPLICGESEKVYEKGLQKFFLLKYKA